MLALVSGLLVLVILVLIAVTMPQQSTLLVHHGGLVAASSPPSGTRRHSQFGAMAFVYGTVIALADRGHHRVPGQRGVALLLTEVVPRRWSQPIVYVVDLLAVVPSVVLGPVGLHRVRPLAAAHLRADRLGGERHPVLGNLFGS